MVDNTLSTVEAAKLMKVSRQWVFKLVKAGKLEAVRIGRDWRVNKESVREYVEAKSARADKSPSDAA